MTAPRIGVIAAVLRKDLISLWPLVLAALIVPLAVIGAVNPDTWERMWRDVIIMLSAVAAVLLMVSVFHQDGLTSVRHDWTTRPIGSATLLIAKLAFITLTILVPAFLGQMTAELRQGHSLTEALWAGLYLLVTAGIVIIPVILIGMATLSVIEAGVIVLALGLWALLIGQLAPYSTALGGSWWVATITQIAILAAVCGMMLWLRGRRVTGIAPKVALVGGLGVLAAGILSFPTSVAVAVENAASPGSPAIDGIQVFEDSACRGGHNLRLTLGATGLTSDTALIVDRTLLTLSTPQRQKAIYSLSGRALIYPGDGKNTAEMLLYPRRELPNATFGATRRHDLTLLHKGPSEDLIVDAPRRLTANFGYCSAVTDQRMKDQNLVRVRCFRPLSGQPEVVRTTMLGAQKTGFSSLSAKYGPGLLRPRMSAYVSLPKDGTQRNAVVRLTAFTTTAHFSRTTRAASATPPACPAWPT